MMKVVKTKKYKDTIYDHSLWYLKSAFDEPEGCLVDYRHGNVTGKDDCSVYKYDFNVESAESWFRLAHFENVPADHAIDVVTKQLGIRIVESVDTSINAKPVYNPDAATQNDDIPGVAAGKLTYSDGTTVCIGDTVRFYGAFYEIVKLHGSVEIFEGATTVTWRARIRTNGGKVDVADISILRFFKRKQQDSWEKLESEIETVLRSGMYDYCVKNGIDCEKNSVDYEGNWAKKVSNVAEDIVARAKKLAGAVE